MAKSRSIHRVRVETWNVKNDGSVTLGFGVYPSKMATHKIAVRVRKGATGGNRPGTFHGATNFPQG